MSPRSNSKNHYDVLGIDDPKNADQASIRKAYLRASLRCHPDKNPGKEEEAKAEFVEVGQAYSVLGDSATRAAYDRELAGGKGQPRPQRQKRNGRQDQATTDKEFDSFMDMFDETVSGMSEEEINMAMGAAAVVGGIIGSIVGSRAAKGNSFLSSAASMMGSAIASQAASKLVLSVHEDSKQRVLEKEERSAAMARGETVPEFSTSERRERMFKDAGQAFQKMAGAAVGGTSTTGKASSENSSSGNRSVNSSSGGGQGQFSWKEAAKLAAMAASACAEMQRGSNTAKR